MVKLHIYPNDKIKVFWGQKGRYIIKLGQHSIYLDRKQLIELTEKSGERLRE